MAPDACAAAIPALAMAALSRRVIPAPASERPDVERGAWRRSWRCLASVIIWLWFWRASWSMPYMVPSFPWLKNYWLTN
jgi:hypothetical protein